MSAKVVNLNDLCTRLGQPDQVEQAWFRLTDKIAIDDDISELYLRSIRLAFRSGYRTALADLQLQVVADVS